MILKNPRLGATASALAATFLLAAAPAMPTGSRPGPSKSSSLPVPAAAPTSWRA